MNCEENKAKLSFLIDGELSPDEEDVVRRHIETCDTCARYFNDLRAVRKALELVPRIPVPSSFEKRLDSRMRRSATSFYSVPVMSRMWARKAVAAVIAAAVLITIVIVLSSIGFQKNDGLDSPEPVAGTHDDPGRVERVPAPDTRPESVPENREKPEAVVVIPEEKDAPQESREPEPREPAPAIDEPGESVPDTELVKKEPETPAVPDTPERSDVVAEDKAPGTTQRAPEEEPLRQSPENERIAQVPDRDFERKFFLAGKEGNIEEQVEMLHLVAETPADETYRFIKRILSQPSNKVDTSVRREALWVLADIGTKEAAGIMLFVYADVDWHVSDAVPTALSRIKREDTLEWLASEILVSSKSEGVRRMVAEALAQSEGPVSQELLAAALAKEQSPLVRIAICEAMGATGDTAAEEILIKTLEDRSWLVREAALRALSKVGTMRCVSAAIRSLNDSKMFVREAAAAVLAENPDVRSLVPLTRLLMHKDIRFRGAVLTALWRITGQKFTKESEWRDWLKEMGPYPETNPDPEAAPPAPAEYLDIPLWSKSVVYLLDASSSMQRDGKIKEAKRLIRNSIIELPEDTRFNVIFFGSEARAFSPTSFARADRRTKAKATDWLEKVRLPEEGRTNFYNALTMVLRNRPDDVIVMSDGVPTEGRFVHPSKLVREISDLNLQLKTRLHAVGFYTLTETEGPTPVPVGPSVDFLKELAGRNHGLFRYRWFNAQADDF